jgi:hypothetical protein
MFYCNSCGQQRGWPQNTSSQSHGRCELCGKGGSQNDVQSEDLPVPLSAWQKVVAANYGGGDYAHVTTLDECRDVGDTLFTFLMIELDPKEDCDDWIEALRRLDAARRDVSMVYDRVRDAAPYLTERVKQEQADG